MKHVQNKSNPIFICLSLMIICIMGGSCLALEVDTKKKSQEISDIKMQVLKAWGKDVNAFEGTDVSLDPRKSPQMLKQYADILALLVWNNYSRALGKIDEFFQLPNVPESYRDSVLSSFWYSVGTNRDVVVVQPGIHLTLDENILCKSLEATVTYDAFTSCVMCLQNLHSVVDSLDLSPPSSSNAHAFLLVAGLYHKSPIDSTSMKKIEVSLVRPSLRSILLLVKQDYEGLIALRNEQIVDLNAPLSLDDQLLLIIEVISYMKIGDMTTAKAKAAQYYEENLISAPFLNNDMTILAEKCGAITDSDMKRDVSPKSVTLDDIARYLCAQYLQSMIE